jgi:hypothetical protein
MQSRANPPPFFIDAVAAGDIEAHAEPAAKVNTISAPTMTATHSPRISRASSTIIRLGNLAACHETGDEQRTLHHTFVPYRLVRQYEGPIERADSDPGSPPNYAPQ